MALKKKKNKEKKHIDWSRFGKESHATVQRLAAEERKRLGLTGKWIGVRAVVPMRVDVKAIREALGLSQSEFAERFHFRERTIQEWEQHRAEPHGPAKILLFAIADSPDLMSAIVQRMEKTTVTTKFSAGAKSP